MKLGIIAYHLSPRESYKSELDSDLGFCNEYIGRYYIPRKRSTQLNISSGQMKVGGVEYTLGSIIVIVSMSRISLITCNENQHSLSYSRDFFPIHFDGSGQHPLNNSCRSC